MKRPLLAAALTLALTGSAWATPADTAPTRPAQAADETFMTLAAAVAEVNGAAVRLARRLQTLEARLQEMRARNEALQSENDRIRKVLRLQAEAPVTLQSWPLDNEVRDANRLLDALASGLADLVPKMGAGATNERRDG